MKYRRMFKVELYGRVRRAVLVEGRSQRAVAREFGIARKTIQKMLRYSVPPGYQRQQAVRRPKLGPWLGVIDAILEEDKTRPAKQRHTAKRIFERLKAEHGVWSKISNALKKLGFRSHNFLAQLLSETSRACTGRGC